VSEIVIARRYAKALFESCEEKKLLKEIAEDFVSINSVFGSNNELKNLIHSQVVQSIKKEAIIKEIFSKNVNALTLTFLRFLCSKKRINLLLEIIAEFQMMYKNVMNIADAEVESVAKLNRIQLDEIKNYLENTYQKKFEIKTKLNEDLVGGFLIRLDDIVIDKSTKYHLKQLETALLAE
jgi:F-type H+-transporting ATPase subunit delta